MNIEIINERDRITFEYKLRDKIKGIEKYYEIVDIKYSTTYDSKNKMINYSAIIIFKEIK